MNLINTEKSQKKSKISKCTDIKKKKKKTSKYSQVEKIDTSSDSYLFYKNIRESKKTISALGTMIADHLSDDVLYYLTISYKDSSQSISNEEFSKNLEFLCMKIFNKTKCHTMIPDIKLYWTKEKSHEISSSLKATDHFHCILTIPKEFHDRFYKKCILSTEDKEYRCRVTRLIKNVLHHEFHPKLLQLNEKLIVKSTLMSKIETKAEVVQIVKYNFKNFTDCSDDQKWGIIRYPSNVSAV